MPTPNTQLRTRRKRFPLTQTELARQVGVAVTSVRRWEAGWQPQPEHIRRLCAVLHASPAALGFGADIDSEPAAPDALPAGAANHPHADEVTFVGAFDPATPPDRSASWLSQVDMDRRRQRSFQMPDQVTLEDVRSRWDTGAPVLRREFISHVASVAGAGAVGRLRLVGADLVPGPRRELPSLLTTVTTSYRRLDNLVGPVSLRETVEEHYHSVLRYVEDAAGEARGRTLAVVAADVAELAGWLAFDEERYGDAACWYRRTAELSKLGQHAGLQAYAMGRMSRLLSHCGDHRQAMHFAEGAVALARGRASARARSWLGATRAYVHACLGDHWSSRRELDKARALLDSTDLPSDEPWLDFYSSAHLDKWEGHCQLRLGEAEPARGVFDHALTIWHPGSVRERAEVVGALADCLIQQGAVPEASRLVGDAYEIAMATGSARNQRAITTSRATLQPWSAEPSVKELDERMAVARRHQLASQPS